LVLRAQHPQEEMDTGIGSRELPRQCGSERRPFPRGTRTQRLAALLAVLHERGAHGWTELARHAFRLAPVCVLLFLVMTHRLEGTLDSVAGQPLCQCQALGVEEPASTGPAGPGQEVAAGVLERRDGVTGPAEEH